MNKGYAWFELYEAAILEVDPAKFEERLDTARRAMRAREVTSVVTAEERHDIADALNNLAAVENHVHSRHSTFRKGA